MAVNITRKTEKAEATSMSGSGRSIVATVEENGVLLKVCCSTGDKLWVALTREDAITFGAAIEELGRQ